MARRPLQIGVLGAAALLVLAGCQSQRSERWNWAPAQTTIAVQPTAPASALVMPGRTSGFVLSDGRSGWEHSRRDDTLGMDRRSGDSDRLAWPEARRRTLDRTGRYYGTRRAEDYRYPRHERDRRDRYPRRY